MRIRASLLFAFALACSSPAHSAAPQHLRLAAAGEPGEPLRLALTLRSGTPGPYELHAYQADAAGRYTPERAMDEPHARLSGRLVLPGLPAEVALESVRPGHYPRAIVVRGRARHIPAHLHLDVLQSGRVIEHWQMVFADDSLLADPYWRDWAAQLHQPIVTLERQEGVWRGAATLQIGHVR